MGGSEVLKQVITQNYNGPFSTKGHTFPSATYRSSGLRFSKPTMESEQPIPIEVNGSCI